MVLKPEPSAMAPGESVSTSSSESRLLQPVQPSRNERERGGLQPAGKGFEPGAAARCVRRVTGRFLSVYSECVRPANGLLTLDAGELHA